MKTEPELRKERESLFMDAPTGIALVRVVLARIGSHSYEGGVNGSCLDCPFATPPLDQAGRSANWCDISNDPTEAYFRCGLPGRDHEEIIWGEYAPCTEREWAAAALEALDGAIKN